MLPATTARDQGIKTVRTRNVAAMTNSGLDQRFRFDVGNVNF